MADNLPLGKTKKKEQNELLNRLFYRLQGLGLSPQRCLYFQGFWDSKLFNGCLVVWPWRIFIKDAIIFNIQNQYLWSVILKFSQYSL